ncbi:MAG: hypothetical protein E7585_01835 [Ruminococcaceae bacterium]|nr:hypothetical protein [Oscillospiraceae bacterium]
MRLAYKAFEPGFVCRGVAFKPIGEKNVTEAANCVKNGWHCAEDPADCLRYYPNFKGSVYCIVGIGGDVDEDAVDSKISCTELTILRVLEPADYLLHILLYMARHPKKDCFAVKDGSGVARNGYVVVRGKNPRAKGRGGDLFAMAREENGEVEQVAVWRVGEDVPEGVYVDINGEEICDEAN